MTITIQTVESTISVSCEELSLPTSSPTEQIDRDGYNATRTLRCNFDDRETLFKELLGFTERSGDNIVHHRPHRYPHNSKLFADSISVRPLEPKDTIADSSVMEWNKAELTVVYKPPEFGAA